MSKIKVAHVITLLELGGAQGNTLFTVTRLDKNQFNVSLICGTGGILDAEAKKIPNITLHWVPNLIRSIRPWKDFAALIQLVKIFKQEQYQIVHTHSSKAGILGRIAARIAGVPILIHSIHGFGFNPYQKLIVRWLFIALEGWIAKFTSILIAVSQQNIEMGLHLNIGTRSQYCLIRSGVDIQKIRETALQINIHELKKELQISDDELIVLTMGPFKIQKDPLAFVRLASKVSKVVPNVKFLMAGDGELRPQIERLIQELNLKNTLQLLGWKKDAAKWMALCDVFVLTSLWEGLPRSGVEALICGKPFVAFSVDGIPEIIHNGKNGFCLPPGQLDLMAEKLIELLQNKSLRNTFNQNAKQTINDSFDIHKMVTQQEELYLQLTHSSNP